MPMPEAYAPDGKPVRLKLIEFLSLILSLIVSFSIEKLFKLIIKKIINVVFFILIIV
jgi:hypothetical protein